MSAVTRAADGFDRRAFTVAETVRMREARRVRGPHCWPMPISQPACATIKP